MPIKFFNIYCHCGSPTADLSVCFETVLFPAERLQDVSTVDSLEQC